MKKMLTLGLALAMVMMFSVGVMADAHDTGSGFDEPDWKVDIGIFENWGDSQLTQDFVYDRWVSHDHVNNDGAVIVEDITTQGTISTPGDQQVKITVPATAVIPCYLELELIGNAGYTKAKSIGGGAEGTVGHGSDNVLMLFDYKITGFMDKDWNFIDPDAANDDVFSSFGVNRDDRDPVYLHACDLYNANMYSNLPYGFQVSAEPLESSDSNNDKTLSMQMRYTFEDSPGWTSAINITDRSLDDGSVPANRLFMRSATIEESVFMQFRVPFDNVPADNYQGDVTFMVWTI